jgi:hypothetical protein
MPEPGDDGATGVDDRDDDGGDDDGSNGDVGEPVFFGGSGSTPAAARTHPNPSMVDAPPDAREESLPPADNRRGRSAPDTTRGPAPRGNRSRKRPDDSV